MSNLKTATYSKIGRNDPRAHYAKLGWESARLGMPFDYDIVDRAIDRALAVSYENHRNRVMVLKSNGITVPAWRAGDMPPKVRAADRRATAINLNCKRMGEPVYYPTPLS